ncbi:lysozyme [Aspergillus lucknowensis]|uniref:Lysozyme-like domain-containing protein n=1 Tax=Aspergillus lucknowensis TaxID=176173 RepID=A0ABR4LN04_9EURO
MRSTLNIFLSALPALPLALAACPGPDVNTATTDLMKSYESWQADVYDDGYGNPTVGYGHLCDDWSCSDVDYDIPLSEEDGLKLFQDDIVAYQDGVVAPLDSSVTLNANQYGALVSWCFNEGTGAVAESNLVARLNAGDDPNTVAEEELPKWVLANGEVSKGLQRRREAEIELFQTSTDEEALPVSC